MYKTKAAMNSILFLVLFLSICNCSLSDLSVGSRVRPRSPENGWGELWNSIGTVEELPAQISGLDTEVKVRFPGTEIFNAKLSDLVVLHDDDSKARAREIPKTDNTFEDKLAELITERLFSRKRKKRVKGLQKNLPPLVSPAEANVMGKVTDLEGRINVLTSESAKMLGRLEAMENSLNVVMKDYVKALVSAKVKLKLTRIKNKIIKTIADKSNKKTELASLQQQMNVSKEDLSITESNIQTCNDVLNQSNSIMKELKQTLDETSLDLENMKINQDITAGDLALSHALLNKTDEKIKGLKFDLESSMVNLTRMLSMTNNTFDAINEHEIICPANQSMTTQCLSNKIQQSTRILESTVESASKLAKQISSTKKRKCDALLMEKDIDQTFFYNDHCYTLSTLNFSNVRTVQDCMDSCQKLGGYLAEIDDEAEMAAINKSIDINNILVWPMISGSDISGSDTKNHDIRGSDEYLRGDWRHQRTGERITYLPWEKGHVCYDTNWCKCLIIDIFDEEIRSFRCKPTTGRHLCEIP